MGRDTGGGTDEITYLFSYLDLNGDGIEKRELDFLQMPKRSVQHFKLFLKNAGQVRNVPGSVAAGWRMHFDPHNVGNVSAIAFQAHCQSLGFSGQIHEIFSELDADQSGQISLDEVDPEAGRLVYAARKTLMGLY